MSFEQQPEAPVTEGAVTDQTAAVEDFGDEASQEQPDPAQSSALPQQPQRLSRREAARQAREAQEREIREVKESLGKFQDTFRTELSQRDQYIAQLRGQLEAFQSVAARPAPQHEAPRGPDPAALEEEALAYLEKGDLRKYHQKTIEAAEARIVAKLPKPEPQRAVPQQAPMDPILQGMLIEATRKVKDPSRLMQLAEIKARELAVMGIPQGYERDQRAIDMAVAALSAAPAPSYTANPGMLGGVPTSRPAARSAAPEVKPLTGEQRRAMEAAGMSEEEYRKYLP